MDAYFEANFVVLLRVDYDVDQQKGFTVVREKLKAIGILGDWSADDISFHLVNATGDEPGDPIYYAVRKAKGDFYVHNSCTTAERDVRRRLIEDLVQIYGTK